MKRRNRGSTIKQQQHKGQIENKEQMIKLGPTMSITTLNVNGLNTQIKELYCQIGFLKESTIYCVQEIHFKYKSQKLK